MEYSESQVVNITQSSPAVHDKNWVTHTHAHLRQVFGCKVRGNFGNWVRVCACVRKCWWITFIVLS